MKLKIERVHEVSAYRSHFTVEWLKDIQTLKVAIGDNNGTDVLITLDEKDARALKTYLEGQL